jgi:hypothetical protein
MAKMHVDELEIDETLVRRLLAAPENSPTLYREAESWLDLVLSERR